MRLFVFLKTVDTVEFLQIQRSSDLNLMSGGERDKDREGEREKDGGTKFGLSSLLAYLSSC